MHNPDDLITAAVAADIVGRDRSTVTRWAAAGKLKPAQRAGTVLLFRRGDVEEFAKALKVVTS